MEEKTEDGRQINRVWLAVQTCAFSCVNTKAVNHVLDKDHADVLASAVTN